MDTTQTRTLTTRKGRSVETHLLDYDALEVCRGLKDNSFAQDLVAREDRWGLSPDQWAWVHILAIEQSAPAERAPQEDMGLDVGEIRARLLRARGRGIKHPKIRLDLGDGRRVVCSLCGPASRYEGCVNLTDGGRYPDNIFYGRIDLEGRWRPTRAAGEDVRVVITSFARDPASTAQCLGRRYGVCCFCGRELSTKESVAVGYGPICADRYGLPWGDPTGYEGATVEDFGL